MLCRNRLAQNLSITTIILAALGILVLIIVGAMISQKSGWFGKSSREIAEQTCSPPNVVMPIGTDCKVVFGAYKDVTSGKLCCKAGTVRT